MPFTFKPIDEASVRAILSWRYESPYDIYDLDSAGEEEIKFFLDSQNGYYSLTDEQGELVAYCCFGLEGQVPGGDYGADALDIGLGMRPDLTGQGRGYLFVKAVLDFGRKSFNPTAFRVTIAEFNQRALRVWQRAGFRPVQMFQRKPDGTAFAILLREA